MPTSETGRTEGRIKGFTLIEVLVVLVILGIAVSLVAVNLSRNPQAVLEDEARRVAALLQHARDEALIVGRSLAWRAGPAGHAFPPQVTVAQLRIAGVPVPADSPLVFSPSGINLPFDLVLASGERRIAVSGDAAGAIGVNR